MSKTNNIQFTTLNRVYRAQENYWENSDMREAMWNRIK